MLFSKSILPFAGLRIDAELFGSSRMGYSTGADLASLPS